MPMMELYCAKTSRTSARVASLSRFEPDMDVITCCRAASPCRPHHRMSSRSISSGAHC
jgi:hypothetical protein